MAGLCHSHMKRNIWSKLCILPQTLSNIFYPQTCLFTTFDENCFALVQCVCQRVCTVVATAWPRKVVKVTAMSRWGECESVHSACSGICSMSLLDIGKFDSMRWWTNIPLHSFCYWIYRFDSQATERSVNTTEINIFILFLSMQRYFVHLLT